MIPADVTLLETTLRDGNYVVDFRFTACDVAWLARELERCGIRMIEIGHGLGLGASAAFRPAAASDEAYIRAARGALTEARFGMFAIPGVATVDHIAMAADLGMDFVRIGANVDKVATMEPLIAEARRRGLFICTNFMKSYCLPPEAFARIGKQAEEFGSQMNYVVDSAGGMLPDDVRRYFEALSAATSIPTGFHGHDNVRLAMANSLVAVECGARYVDTTLFGIGRGSGNAATELMAALLKQRYGLLEGVDEMRLLKLAEREAAPLLHARHQETMSMALGLAQVHSMYLERILERAKAEGVDPLLLAREVGRIDRLDCSDNVLEQAAEAARGATADMGLPEGGLLALAPASDLASQVAAAENLAEKAGLPCRFWIGETSGETRLQIERTAAAVEVRVSGDPAPVLGAVCRPISRVLVRPGFERRAAALMRVPCPVESLAEAGPATGDAI